jgi:type IV secretory pathway protease TraF
MEDPNGCAELTSCAVRGVSPLVLAVNKASPAVGYWRTSKTLNPIGAGVIFVIQEASFTLDLLSNTSFLLVHSNSGGMVSLARALALENLCSFCSVFVFVLFKKVLR